MTEEITKTDRPFGSIEQEFKKAVDELHRASAARPAAHEIPSPTDFAERARILAIGTPSGLATGVKSRPAAPGPTIEEIERKRIAEAAHAMPGVGAIRSQRLSGEDHVVERFIGTIPAGGRYPDDLKISSQDAINRSRSRSLHIAMETGLTEGPEVRPVNQSDVTDKMRALYDMAMQLGDRAAVIGAAMAGMRTDSQPTRGKPPANTLFEQQIEALDEIMALVDNADFELRRVRAVLE